MTDAVSGVATPAALHAIARARGWVIDVDGCLVRTTTAGGLDGTAIPGASEFLAWLRDNGRTVIVCTNASQRTVAHYASHLRTLGLDVRDEEMITAASAAALHVATRHPGASVLAVGAEGLDDALQARGVVQVRPGGRLADVVIVGAADHYTTAALNAACLAVADHGAPLYVTVDAPWFQGGMGRSISASTAIAAAISSVTGVRPQVCGKPSPALARVLGERIGASGTDIVVVGDVAEIEIRLAHMMGAHGVLVLSGGTSAADLAWLPPEHRPHLHVRDVKDLLEKIAHA